MLKGRPNNIPRVFVNPGFSGFNGHITLDTPFPNDPFGRPFRAIAFRNPTQG